MSKSLMRPITQRLTIKVICDFELMFFLYSATPATAKHVRYLSNKKEPSAQPSKEKFNHNRHTDKLSNKKMSFC